jgi:hypothetical protein
MIRINREFIAENTGTGKTFINPLPPAKEKMLRVPYRPLRNVRFASSDHL